MLIHESKILFVLRKWEKERLQQQESIIPNSDIKCVKNKPEINH